MDKYYRTKEIAEMFGVTERTVFNWLKLKGLKYTKVGGLLMVKDSDLTKWIETQN